MGWKAISRGWLAAAWAFSLAACASGGESTQFLSSALKGDPTAGFTNRVSSNQVVLYWNCMRPEPGILRVEGIAHNPWSSQAIRFLEFDLVGVDDRDRQVSGTSAALPAILLWTNETSAFRLDLKTAQTEARFDLYYQYRFNEGDSRIFAGPPGAGPQRLTQQLRRFLVRDVCSETQHRIR
jgi:hypothetical protein